MVRHDSCPDEADLDAFIRGELGEAARAAVEAHLAGCSECRQVVAFAATAAPEERGPDPAAALMSRVVAMGRYLILEALGAGAMGVVYLAYDPDLDRKIALKLLNATGTGASGGASRDRLLREAKAMARVKHPNVVGVFDAGALGEQVYIAMELVEGTSLGRWLAQEPRTADQIVDRFVAAGRGLAAAHAAGLVHRDFKPDNVLVGRDGQVCVTDFGLAQADAGAFPDAGGGPLDLSRSGVIAGTPAYMAPEQLRGERADARSDQFAFCVALCEGLTGKRPYAGRNLEELRAALDRPPELPAGVPPRIRRALLRGLSADPALRFPSMDPLLAELGAWGRRRRTRGAAAAAVLGVVAVLAIGFGLTEPSCGAVAASEADGLWTPRREAVRAAFEATGSPVAATTFAGLERVVGRHVEDYRVARVATCEADALPDDPRVACLAERRRDLGALFDVLAGADAAVVRDAVLAAHAIRPIALCGDLASAAGALSPTSPEAVAVADALSRAGALRDAGRFEPGLALVRETRAAAEALPDPRFGFRARLLEGELLIAAGRFDEAAEALNALYFVATAGRDDETATRALLQLVRVHGDHLRHAENGLTWGRHADAAIRRLGDVPLLRAQWHFLEGIIANNEARSDDAIGHFEQALAIDTEVLGSDHIQVATDLAGLGSAYAMAGRFDEALVRQQEALAATEAALGPEHPRVVNRLINVAITYGRSGHGGEGIPYLERALPVARATLGPEHPTTLLTVGVLGTLYFEIEEVTKARGVLEEGAAVVAAKDLWNPNLEHLFLNLAGIRTAEGRYDDALESLAWARRCVLEGTISPQMEAHHRLLEGTIRLRQGDAGRALALAREARALAEPLGDDVLLGDSGANTGRALVALGRFDDAARELERAREHALRAYGPDSPLEVAILVARGEAELGRGGQAAPWFEEAAAMGERAGRIEDLGLAWFGLARAVARTDPARAVTHAERARDTFAQRDFLAPEQARVEAWLAEARR